jgi:PKD repeat protein
LIGVKPSELDFGSLCPGKCTDLELALRNADSKPGSQLIISDLIVAPPFALINPPTTPLTIPSDGTLVELTIEYCASGAGSQSGALLILATNAANSPFKVSLNGVADPAPQCDAGGPYFALPAEPITFDAGGSSDPGGTIGSYVWEFGDGATGSGPVVVHSYVASGTYSARLSLTDDCGGESSCQATVVVSMNEPPICNAGGPYRGDRGVPVYFSGAGSSDPDGEIVSYLWDFGDGYTATGVSPGYIYVDYGFYTVSLTVTDDQAASSECSATIEIVDFQLPICDPGGPYSAPAGELMTFDGSGSSDPDGTIVSYEWDFGDCTSPATGSNPTHTYTLAGNYVARLCVRDNDGQTSCCDAEVRITDKQSMTPARMPWTKSIHSDRTGANPHITLPLHAVPAVAGCAVTEVDCQLARPTVNVPPNTSMTIYLMAFNYSSLTGVQTAFEWDADWILCGAAFDCAPQQLSARLPSRPGGPKAGTITTAFNCMTTGNLLVIGRLFMTTGLMGCLRQVQSSYPFGTCALDCNQQVDLIMDPLDERLGRICVTEGGNDTCKPVVVRATTWGQVKATYR